MSAVLLITNHPIPGQTPLVTVEGDDKTDLAMNIRKRLIEVRDLMQEGRMQYEPKLILGLLAAYRAVTGKIPQPSVEIICDDCASQFVPQTRAPSKKIVYN